jgi:hypothetical protein
VEWPSPWSKQRLDSGPCRPVPPLAFWGLPLPHLYALPSASRKVGRGKGKGGGRGRSHLSQLKGMRKILLVLVLKGLQRSPTNSVRSQQTLCLLLLLLLSLLPSLPLLPPHPPASGLWTLKQGTSWIHGLSFPAPPVMVGEGRGALPESRVCWELFWKMRGGGGREGMTWVTATPLSPKPSLTPSRP